VGEALMPRSTKLSRTSLYWLGGTASYPQRPLLDQTTLYLTPRTRALALSVTGAKL
jgi:hypothetical protein